MWCSPVRGIVQMLLQPGWRAERWTHPCRVQQGRMVQDHETGQALDLWDIFCCSCHEKPCFSLVHLSHWRSKQLNYTLTWRFEEGWGWGWGYDMGWSWFFSSTQPSVKVTTHHWCKCSCSILYNSSSYVGLIKLHLFSNGLPIIDSLITVFHYDQSCVVNITAFYKVSNWCSV